MDDSKTTISAGSMPGQDLSRYVALIKSRPVKYDGANAFVVSKGTLNKLEEMIHLKLSDGSSLSPNALIDMNQELQDARRQRDEAINSQNAAKAALETVQHDYEEYSKSVSAVGIQNQKLIEDYSSKITELSKSQEEFKAKTKTLKDDLDKAKRTSSHTPEEVRDILTELNSSRTTVKVIGDEKNRLQNDVTKLQKEVQTHERRLAALKEENDLTKAKINNVKTLNLEDFDKEPLPPQQLVIQNRMVKKLVGEAGLKWFQKYNDVERANIREQAYNLMLTTKSAPNKAALSLHKLIQLVYTWVKTASQPPCTLR